MVDKLEGVIKDLKLHLSSKENENAELKEYITKVMSEVDVLKKDLKDERTKSLSLQGNVDKLSA